MDLLQTNVLIFRYKLIYELIVLTTQPLSHCGATKLHGRGGVCRHLEKHTNRNQNFCLTSPKRTSHSAPSESQAHTRPLPPPRLHSDSLFLSVFHYFRLPRPSLRFHGSAERAITSASVWRPGDEALRGCGQTPGHA